MIGTSTNHAAVSITIDGASIGDPSRIASLRTGRAGIKVLEWATPFEQSVLLNPLAGVSLRGEASRCPDHRTELAQGNTVTTVLPDEDVIDWLGHALHVAWREARYMPRLHKLSCSTGIYGSATEACSGIAAAKRSHPANRLQNRRGLYSELSVLTYSRDFRHNLGKSGGNDRCDCPAAIGSQ
jgi:hypothetical protein